MLSINFYPFIYYRVLNAHPLCRFRWIGVYQDDSVTNCELQDIGAWNNAGTGLLNCCLRSIDCVEPVKTGIDWICSLTVGSSQKYRSITSLHKEAKGEISVCDVEFKVWIHNESEIWMLGDCIGYSHERNSRGMLAEERRGRLSCPSWKTRTLIRRWSSPHSDTSGNKSNFAYHCNHYEQLRGRKPGIRSWLLRKRAPTSCCLWVAASLPLLYLSWFWISFRCQSLVYGCVAWLFESPAAPSVDWFLKYEVYLLKILSNVLTLVEHKAVDSWSWVPKEMNTGSELKYWESILFFIYVQSFIKPFWCCQGEAGFSYQSQLCLTY